MTSAWPSGIVRWAFNTTSPLRDSVWTLSCSIASTNDISVDFFSCPYWDVSIRGVPDPQRINTEVLGCPIRRSPDHRFLASTRSLSQLGTSFFGTRTEPFTDRLRPVLRQTHFVWVWLVEHWGIWTLVLADWTRRCLRAYIPSLSTGSFTRVFNEVSCSGWVSSLDAFSFYLLARSCSAMPCQTTDRPEAPSESSSRTISLLPSDFRHSL